MKNEENAKNLMLIVVLVCLILAVFYYMFVFKKFNDKTDDLKRENVTLQARVDELSVYYDNRVVYESGIKEMETEINNIFVPYPCDVREENALALGVDMYNGSELEFTGISLGSREVFQTIEADVVKGAELENYNGPIIFATRDAGYTDRLDYVNLKKSVQTIADKAGKGTIKSITYVYNKDENKLEGTIDYTFDFVSGIDGKVYEPLPDIVYTKGVTDLFKIPENVVTEEND